MKLSIRTRLGLLIALVFFGVLGFILGSSMIALYWELNREIDKELQLENGWMIQLFETEFLGLLTPGGQQDEALAAEFYEELHEIYGYKQEFVIFALKTGTGRRVFSDGGLKNAQLLLPKGFWEQPEGFSNQLLAGRRYRVLISSHSWGFLVVGKENRTFFEVLDELLDILTPGIPLILILVLAGGWFLSRLAMRPVAEVAAAADKITMSQLEQRLPAYRGEDEFGQLVLTLNRMIGRIEAGVQKVRQFTQDAAHELRTPLTILRGELELLYQSPGITEEQLGALQKALDRTIMMSKIIDNLLLLAQSDSGQYPIQKTVFRLDEVLRQTVEDAEILAHNHSLEVRLERCDEVLFKGDEGLIRRLLLNLSENALKFTHSGMIQFTLAAHQELIELTVRDSGIGIPAEDLKHIFDRFYRVNKARTRAEGGSGLGLAICRWIVAAHGGSLHIDSEVGRGTMVRVELPAADG